MASSNKKIVSSTKTPDTESILNELKTRVHKLKNTIETSFKRLSRHFCAILSVCDNLYNQHFAENALNLFCFLVFEIETLNLGYLKFEGQEKLYKGFISKQTGTFDKELLKKNKGDLSTRLTLCCLEFLDGSVSSYL